LKVFEPFQGFSKVKSFLRFYPSFDGFKGHPAKHRVLFLISTMENAGDLSMGKHGAIN